MVGWQTERFDPRATPQAVTEIASIQPVASEFLRIQLRSGIEIHVRHCRSGFANVRRRIAVNLDGRGGSERIDLNPYPYRE
jgi:hypothetical protein